MTTANRTRPPGIAGRSFRIFWSGQSVSYFGTEVTFVALPLVAVLVLGATPAQMGVVVAAETVPSLLGPVLLGKLADCRDRRRLLLLADYGRLVALALVPFAAVTGWLSMPLVVAVAFAVGMFTVINDVAFFAIVPNLVPGADLVAANARLEGARAAATMVGPPAGGGASQAFGPANALLLDVTTYLFSIVQLHRLRGRVEARDPDGAAEPWYAGLREVWRNPPLRLLATGSGLFNFFSAGGFAVIGLFMIREVGLSPTLYGIGLAFGGAGGLAGAALATRVMGRLGPRKVLSAALLGCGSAEIILILARDPGATAFGLLALSQLIGATTVTVYVIVNAALRQQIIPPAIRGRTFAAMRLTNRGLMPLGALVFGALAGWTSMRLTIATLAAGQVAVAALFAVRSRVLPDRMD